MWHHWQSWHLCKMSGRLKLMCVFELNLLLIAFMTLNSHVLLYQRVHCKRFGFFWLNSLRSIFGRLTKIYIYFLCVEILTLIWQTQNLYNLWFLSPVFCSCTNICICMVSLCFLFLLLFLKLRYILKVHTETLAPVFSCQNLGAFNLFKVK